MSLSIAGIGAVQPVYVPVGAAVPYAPSSEGTASVAATTAGVETGAASVVYEPGPSDAGAQYTYPNPEAASRAAASAPAPAPSEASSSGDEAVVQATGGAVVPPPALPETPHAAAVKKLLNDVWSPVGPVALDPAAANAATPAPVPVGQAEASAQASYTAVADAMIAGAPLSDLEKFA